MTKPARDPKTGRFLPRASTPEEQVAAGHQYIEDRYGPTSEATLGWYDTKHATGADIAAVDNRLRQMWLEDPQQPVRRHWLRVLAAALLLALAAAVTLALIAWARR